MTRTLEQQIKGARRCGAPLVCVTTPDAPALVGKLATWINSGAPILTYDIVRGFQPVNEPGRAAAVKILDGADPALMTDPTTALDAARRKAPEKTVIIALGAERFISTEGAKAAAAQALANTRDPFKASGRMVILLSAVSLQLPGDLGADALRLDDDPPDTDERAAIVAQLHQDAGLEAPAAETLAEAAKATRGLSAYATEQTAALSLSKSGLDTAALWQRWTKAINATPGLTVDQSGATLADVGGLDNLKTFARRMMAGRDAPAAIVRIEEIEKALSGSGAGGDSSGTTQGMLQALLTFMQEESATGLIAVGPPGSGKSLSSVAIGSAGPVPTITLDLGSLKGSLVGETEQNTRRALSTIKALAGGNAFFCATCNSLAALPPELKRRFQYGIWFFDLPDAQERAAIWKIWLAKYPEVKGAQPDDTGWTGAEIRTAVQIAHRLNCTPAEAAAWIVPVCRTAAEQIEALRRQAAGRYLSASQPGPYQYTQTAAPAAPATGRRLNLEG